MGAFWIGILIFWLLCGVLASHIAEQKQAGSEGFWMGLLLGPAGVIAAGFLGRRPMCARCGGRLNVARSQTSGHVGPLQTYPVCQHCGVELTAVTETAGQDWESKKLEFSRPPPASRSTAKKDWAAAVSDLLKADS